jgi:ABC-type Fe3+-siderophore transport system permease subunit
VSTLCKRFMRWRCDDTFSNSLDRLTLGISKGAALALVTYLVIKVIAIAHDNEWQHLLTGWGQWYMLEITIGVILPLVLFTMAVRDGSVSMARFGAYLAVIGIMLNRLNTALISFNWNLYQEIPHWREVVITITIYATYILVYRAILARMPILYYWQEKKD